MDYESMLARAQEQLPGISVEKRRFELPKAKGHIQGNRTVISNFNQIADTLSRPVEHFLKYVLRELATPGDLKDSGLIIGRKISASRINEKIAQYVTDFVLCPVCKGPDTKLLREDKTMLLKCSVCGAREPVKVKL